MSCRFSLLLRRTGLLIPIQLLKDDLDKDGVESDEVVLFIDDDEASETVGDSVVRGGTNGKHLGVAVDAAVAAVVSLFVSSTWLLLFLSASLLL